MEPHEEALGKDPILPCSHCLARFQFPLGFLSSETLQTFNCAIRRHF